jgi:superfamily II DNA/RNA helicase
MALAGGVRFVLTAGIGYREFTGEMAGVERDKAVKDYNANRIRALLISGAGGEGLDLKGTSLVQMLELHWNKARLLQAAARAVRRGSHSHLPEDKRRVKVLNYLATGGNASADEYLRRLSQLKEDEINQVAEQLKRRQPGLPKAAMLRLLDRAGRRKAASCRGMPPAAARAIAKVLCQRAGVGAWVAV